MTAFLLTRPQGQNETMAGRLRAMGKPVLEFPMLEIVATAGDRSVMLALDQYDHVVFISSNAANLGLRALSDLWPQWPLAPTWYAVGRTTAKAMAAWNLQAIVPAQEDSAGLLSLPSLSGIAGQRVLIVRGQGGRELLMETLSQRGARVDYLEVYARRPVQLEVEAKKQVTAFNPVIALLYSGDSAAALAGNFMGDLGRFRIVVPSTRVADVVAKLGFAFVRSAGGTSEADMTGAAREVLMGVLAAAETKD
ncbi:MAG: uroporphyrinogen-III synthase [Pseudomonadota bacterium]